MYVYVYVCVCVYMCLCARKKKFASDVAIALLIIYLIDQLSCFLSVLFLVNQFVYIFILSYIYFQKDMKPLKHLYGSYSFIFFTFTIIPTATTSTSNNQVSTGKLGRQKVEMLLAQEGQRKGSERERERELLVIKTNDESTCVHAYMPTVTSYTNHEQQLQTDRSCFNFSMYV